MNTSLRPRLRRIDRILRLWWLLPVLYGAARWVPGHWQHHWWEPHGTQPYHGQQPGPGVGEG